MSLGLSAALRPDCHITIWARRKKTGCWFVPGRCGC